MHQECVSARVTLIFAVRSRPNTRPRSTPAPRSRSTIPPVVGDESCLTLHVNMSTREPRPRQDPSLWHPRVTSNLRPRVGLADPGDCVGLLSHEPSALAPIPSRLADPALDAQVSPLCPELGFRADGRQHLLPPRAHVRGKRLSGCPSALSTGRRI